MLTKIEKAKRDVESAQRTMEEEIESVHTNYQSVVGRFCDAIQPTDEEAVRVGYENAEHLPDSVNQGEDEANELVKSLNEILSFREKSKAAGA